MIEKIKELTKDTAIYGVSTIVSRFLNFLLVPFYTHVFIPKEYGVSSNVYAFIAFISILYIYGMDVAFQKYTANAPEENKKVLFSTPFIFVIITSVIFSIFIFILHNPFNELMKVPDKHSSLIYYMIWIMLFDSIVLVPFANLRLQRKARLFALIKMTNVFIQIALNVILIFVFKIGIKGIFISNLAASVITFVMLMPEIKRFFILKINKIELKKMLLFGIPYVPASIGATIVQVIDRPLVQRIAGDEALGIYQANYRLGIFMMLIVSMFQYAWQPFLLTNAKEKNAKEIFAKVLTLFVLAASLVWIVLSMFIDNLMTIHIFGRSIIQERYWSGLHIVPVVLLAYIFHGMYVNFTAGIYIENKNKYLPIITGAGAAINILANLVLIPLKGNLGGIMGAALATLAAYVVMAGMIFILAQKYYPIKYEYKKVISILSLMISCITVYYLLYYSGSLSIPLKVLIIVIYILLLFALKVIKKEEILQTVKLFQRKTRV